MRVTKIYATAGHRYRRKRSWRWPRAGLGRWRAGRSTDQRFRSAPRRSRAAERSGRGWGASPDWCRLSCAVRSPHVTERRGLSPVGGFPLIITVIGIPGGAGPVPVAEVLEVVDSVPSSVPEACVAPPVRVEVGPSRIVPVSSLPGCTARSLQEGHGGTRSGRFWGTSDSGVAIRHGDETRRRGQPRRVVTRSCGARAVDTTESGRPGPAAGVASGPGARGPISSDVEAIWVVSIRAASRDMG